MTRLIERSSSRRQIRNEHHAGFSRAKVLERYAGGKKTPVVYARKHYNDKSKENYLSWSPKMQQRSNYKKRQRYRILCHIFVMIRPYILGFFFCSSLLQFYFFYIAMKFFIMVTQFRLIRLDARSSELTP